MARSRDLLGGTLRCVLAACIAPALVHAQRGPIARPVAEIERRLGAEDFEVLRAVPSRHYQTDRTFQLTIAFEDGSVELCKLAPAVRGGEAFNNRPEYEVASYVLQKLFLDESEYVVPPTVVRALPVEEARAIVDMAPGRHDPVGRTFSEWPVTLVVLQYWLQGVEPVMNAEIEDEDRFASDPAFARHAANFNLLTYLIRHSDSNAGNFLMSEDPGNPRIFSVDNGIAFSSTASDRGWHWRDLHFDRFPASTVDRLRRLDLATLERELGVLAQLELQDGDFMPATPGENLDPEQGVRRADGVIQVGLPVRDIEAVHERVIAFLEDVDAGRYAVFADR